LVEIRQQWGRNSPKLLKPLDELRNTRIIELIGTQQTQGA
jgi:hypothetical protein